MTTTILHFILTVSEKYVTNLLLFGLFTAARDWPEPQVQKIDTPETPKGASSGKVTLYGVGGLAVVLVCVACLLFIHCKSVKQDFASDSSGRLKKSYIAAETEGTV